MFPPVFHYFLNLAQQGLEGQVLDCLRFQRLLELESEFHEARLVGTCDILLFLHESLVLHLFAQPGQSLLQLLVLQLALTRTAQLSLQDLVRNPAISSISCISFQISLLTHNLYLSCLPSLATARLFSSLLVLDHHLRTAFLYHPSPSLLFIDNINNLNCSGCGQFISIGCNSYMGLG